jgi:hypothetical protein
MVRAPVGSKANPNIFSAENFIPLEWFLMYDAGEKKYFFTHTGFGAIRQDAIYYITRVGSALGRLGAAVSGIDAFLASSGAEGSPTLSGILSDLKSGAENLSHWLSGFDAGSFVMLNYGDISQRMDPGQMKNEDSVSELGTVLALAGEGNTDDAEKVLAMLLSKWDSINRTLAPAEEKRPETLQ